MTTSASPSAPALVEPRTTSGASAAPSSSAAYAPSAAHSPSAAYSPSSVDPDAAHARYLRCVTNSKRIRWEIERDVIRGRRLEGDKKFLPDSLSLVNNLEFLNVSERQLLSQIQGRTYANVFGLVERFINAKVLEVSQEHWLGDQVALEALVRFSDEELKHQELFRRIDSLASEALPPGYEFLPQPDDVAHAVLSKSTWAVLGLTCLIELFTQAHYKQSIAPNPDLSELFKDVFLFHWKEESQHAVLDELEWRREDAKLSAPERDGAVSELIELVAAVDGILQMQSTRDAQYFAEVCGRELSGAERVEVAALLLKAYRWQYVFSGIQQTQFVDILRQLVTAEQFSRIEAALETLV